MENGRVGQKLIAENIKKLRVEASATLMRTDATNLGGWIAAPFDLVFLDPPYGKGLGKVALTKALAGGWLGPDAMEENAAMDAPDGFARRDKRKYGDTWITLLGVA